MKKMAVLLAGAALLLTVSSGVANAYSINSNYTTTANGELTSSYSSLYNFKVETFNSVAKDSSVSGASGLQWQWSGSATIVNGNLSGKYAAPTGDNSNYVSVPNPSSNGSATIALGGLYNYFGLWWSSIDTYNTISFYNGTSLVQSFTGSDIVSNANGSSSLYVNFLDLPEYDNVVMSSTQYAFEADNIAIGNSNAPVPEPGTFALLGAGLLGLGIYSRRKNKK